MKLFFIVTFITHSNKLFSSLNYHKYRYILGRCTLLSALMQQQIMMLESTIAAYTLSALSLHNARSSERQMMASSWYVCAMRWVLLVKFLPLHTTSSHPAIPYLISPYFTLPHSRPVLLYLPLPSLPLISVTLTCLPSPCLSLSPLLSCLLLSSPLLSSQVDNDGCCVLLLRLSSGPHAPPKTPQVTVPPRYLPFDPRTSSYPHR
jgi:hypothetical protein